MTSSCVDFSRHWGQRARWYFQIISPAELLTPSSISRDSFVNFAVGYIGMPWRVSWCDTSRPLENSGIAVREKTPRKYSDRDRLTLFPETRIEADEMRATEHRWINCSMVVDSIEEKLYWMSNRKTRSSLDLKSNGFTGRSPAVPAKPARVPDAPPPSCFLLLHTCTVLHLPHNSGVPAPECSEEIHVHLWHLLK